MSKKYHDVRVLMHRAFAVFLTVFLISDVGSVYASRNLEIAQQGETRSDAMRAEAFKLFQEGLQLFEQGSKESLLAARKKLEAALVLWKKLGHKQGQATALLGIGRVYADLGEKQKALQFYNQALPLLHTLEDRGIKAITFNNIGQVHHNLGEMQKALQYYNQGLLLYRAVGDRGGEGTTLNNIGQSYSNLGENQKALQYLNQALPLLRAAGNRGVEGTTLNNIGGVYLKLGEKQKALQKYNQALPLLVVNGRGEASTLNNIGKGLQ